MTETCEGPDCSNPRPPAPATGGTRPRFCSDPCRKRAYRARRRTGPASQEAAGTSNSIAGTATPPRWTPPAITRRPAPEDPGPCAACGTERTWTPRGTQAACPGCRELQMPPRTLKAHAPNAGERQLLTQQQRDDAQFRLDERRQELLDDVKDGLADDDMPSWARGRLRSIDKMVRDAPTMQRLAELAARLAQLGSQLAADGWSTEAEEDAPDDEDEPPGGQVIQGEVEYDYGPMLLEAARRPDPTDALLAQLQHNALLRRRDPQPREITGPHLPADPRPRPAGDRRHHQHEQAIADTTMTRMAVARASREREAAGLPPLTPAEIMAAPGIRRPVPPVGAAVRPSRASGLRALLSGRRPAGELAAGPAGDPVVVWYQCWDYAARAAAGRTR